MIDQLIKVVLLIGGAIAAYVVADNVTKTSTGKHIHEHVFEWYRRLMDTITGWLQDHKDRLGVSQIIIKILDYVDKAVCATKSVQNRVIIAVYGEANRKTYKVTEEEVPIKQAFEMFPGLAEGDTVILTEPEIMEMLV